MKRLILSSYAIALLVATAAEAQNVFPPSGNVGIGTAQPQQELHVNGNVLLNAPFSDWLFLRQARDKEGGGGFHIHNPWGNSNQPQGDPSRNQLQIAYRTPDGRDLWGQFVIHGPSGNIGIGTAAPAAKLDVQGTTRTAVLQITGGSDLAEAFEIASAETIRPGMLVSIDPDHPGRLRVASDAYDRTVAGVVSGAQGLGPGLTMGHEGHAAKGSLPVALSGRVYALADADKGSIEPGDLLTTADTPGHAMKVTDHDRARGAVIGKAMTPLTKGRGEVLVLVTLQ